MISGRSRGLDKGLAIVKCPIRHRDRVMDKSREPSLKTFSLDDSEVFPVLSRAHNGDSPVRLPADRECVVTSGRPSHPRNFGGRRADDRGGHRSIGEELGRRGTTDLWLGVLVTESSGGGPLWSGPVAGRTRVLLRRVPTPFTEGSYRRTGGGVVTLHEEWDVDDYVSMYGRHEYECTCT